MTTTRSALLQGLAAAFCGVLFGIGLCLSQMVNPAKVMAFLDIAGNWDPSLLFVMLGAFAVAGPSFYWTLKRQAPVLDESFDLPARNRIDNRLLLGSAIFGIGWGLSGFCPGPAITALSTGSVPVLQFVISMLLGMLAHRELFGQRSRYYPG